MTREVRRSRGFALHGVMVVIVALAALLAAVSLRIEAGNARVKAAERRTQALWLARTAVATRAVMNREVKLGPGTTARVRVYAFGGGRFAADVIVPGAGAARVEQTFGSDGRISAVSESWRAGN